MRNLILGLIVAVVGGMALWYLQRRTPDITYYVSSPIPIPGQGDEAAFAHQIKVSNTGSALAARITVRFPGTRADHQIQKWRETDEVKVELSKNETEIEYPELPPGGEFTVNIKSADSLSLPQSVKVFHQNGAARPAFSRETSPLGILVLYFLFAGSIVLMWVVWVQRDAVGSYKGWRLLGAPDEMLSMLSEGRRWYMSKGQWASVRESLFKEMTKSIADDYRHNRPVDLDKTAAYRVLDSEPPEFLTREEGVALSEAAEKCLEQRFGKVAVSMRLQDRKLEILGTRKPARLRAEKWVEWADEIEKSWVAEEISSCAWFTGLQDLAERLSSPKPPHLSQDSWGGYLKFVRTCYENLLSRQMRWSPNKPVQFLRAQRLDLLEDHGQALLSMAYEMEHDRLSERIARGSAEAFLAEAKPDWLSTDDHLRLREWATKIVELPGQERRHAVALQVFETIAVGRPLPASKPDALSEDDWESISALAKSTSEKNSELRQLECKVRKDAITVSADRDRVSRQLHIIHEVLSDPTAVDRLEHFENPFAPGNFTNLRRIARYLAELAKEGDPRAAEGTKAPG